MRFLFLFLLLPATGYAADCDVKAFGARGDGVTKDTAAIQAAIDACAGTGRAVRLHDGTFLSGMITLKSDLRFVIEPTATLKGTQDDADYPDTYPPTDNSQLRNCRKALVFALGATHLTIEGGGLIDGNGNVPKWIGPSSVHPEYTRPMAVFIAQSSDVTIQNIRMQNAAMWGIVNFETDHLVIRGVKIHTPLSGNRDGIDIVDCHHVLIEDCDIFSEDDSICLKSGTARGVVDVTVRNCHVRQSTVANGLKLGTASTGAFRDVTFEDITVENVDKAAMAVESVDGAAIEGIHFRRIQFHRAGSAIFVILGHRGASTVTLLPKSGSAVEPNVGSIQDVSFEDITGDQPKHSWGSAISGTRLGNVTYSPKDIFFKNVHITHGGGVKIPPKDLPEYDGRYPDPNLWGNLPAYGFYLRHVSGIRFIQSSWKADPADSRPGIVQTDIQGFIQN